MHEKQEIKDRYKQIIDEIKLLATPKNKIDQKAIIKFEGCNVTVVWDFKYSQEIKNISFELSKDLVYEMDLHENGNFTLIKYSKDEYPYLALKDEEIIEFLREIEAFIEKLRLVGNYSTEFKALDFLT